MALLQPGRTQLAEGPKISRTAGQVGTPVTWKSVRLRAVVCRTTTSMRCCPSALRTAALSGFSPGWSAGHDLNVQWTTAFAPRRSKPSGIQTMEQQHCSTGTQ